MDIGLRPESEPAHIARMTAKPGRRWREEELTGKHIALEIAECVTFGKLSVVGAMDKLGIPDRDRSMARRAFNRWADRAPAEWGKQFAAGYKADEPLPPESTWIKYWQFVAADGGRMPERALKTYVQHRLAEGKTPSEIAAELDRSVGLIERAARQ